MMMVMVLLGAMALFQVVLVNVIDLGLFVYLIRRVFGNDIPGMNQPWEVS